MQQGNSLSPADYTRLLDQFARQPDLSPVPYLTAEPEPTDIPPGPRKVAVLERRRRLRQPLWINGDCLFNEESALAKLSQEYGPEVLKLSLPMEGEEDGGLKDGRHGLKNGRPGRRRFRLEGQP